MSGDEGRPVLDFRYCHFGPIALGWESKQTTHTKKIIEKQELLKFENVRRSDKRLQKVCENHVEINLKFSRLNWNQKEPDWLNSNLQKWLGKA